MSLSKAIGVISGINEFGNFFQLVRSAGSYMQSQWNGSKEKVIKEDDVLKLQSDLECLSETLPAMYDLIDRAEWRSHVPCVAQLLSNLKDVVYDTEDLLDEVRWYEMKVEIEGNATHQLSPFIDFFHSITQGTFNKVTNIQKRLSNVSNQLEKMGLHEATPRFDKSVRPETTSFPTEENIFGRQRELNELIELIGVPINGNRVHSKRKRTCSGVLELSAENCNEVATRRFPVLPVVGIGGVGKTTLVQHIRKNEQVDNRFDQNIIWICVSDDFDVKRITKEVTIQMLSRMENTTHNVSIREDLLKTRQLVYITDNLDDLQHTLELFVKRKRFLLILDDIWEDVLKENGQCWNRFCAPFKNAPVGSMMLVTTRSEWVADHVGTIVPFPLEDMKSDAFWDFFKLCTFGHDKASSYPELESIGRQIVQKLRGSPLAAKTLGRLLQMNLDTTHWTNIHNSELWLLRQEGVDILPALRLSYTYLPLHLKRCFAFCAVYPKDHQFEKHNLASIWVAEGFVEPQGDTPIEDIGCQYFEDLANRSFFQMDNGYYVMHDLMHDMAQLVSRDECFIIKNESDFRKVPKSVRHLSILSNIKNDNPKLLSLCKYRKLRTLLYDGAVSTEISSSPMDCWCSELRCIRVFSSASMREVPEGISNMKHLRYLGISMACPSKILPPGFYCLYNLQVLYARNSEFESLSNKLLRLRNLQWFWTRVLQYKNGVVSSLSLIGYPGESFDCWFQTEHMQGSLTSCEPGGYSGLLKRIPFFGNGSSQCGSLSVIPTVLVERNNYNTDSIFSSLSDITIEDCICLTNLEQFLQPSYSPNIRKLKIVNCKQLVSVPTARLRDLRCLEELIVSQCPKINSRCLQVPSLKKLELKESSNLGQNIDCCSLNYLDLSYSSSTSIQLQLGSLRALQKLRIAKCISLTSVGVSTQHGGIASSITPFSSLTRLAILRCDELLTMNDILTQELPAIETIHFDNCYGLRSLPGERFGSFSSLKALHIRSCPRLSWQSGIVLPSSLRFIFLESCGDLSASFPSCLENLTSLESLQLVSCERLVSIPGPMNLTSLRKLWIQNCPHLVSVGGPQTIENKDMVYISGCPLLVELHQPFCRWRKFLSYERVNFAICPSGTCMNNLFSFSFYSQNYHQGY